MAQVYGGAKLGTRVATLVSNAIIYTHNRLHSAKHKLAMAVFSSISDVVSDEVHETLGPVLRKLHEEYPDNGIAHPLLNFLATQKGQWQAIVGTGLSSGGILSSIATIMNNELAPIVYEAVSGNPHLLPDPFTLCRMAALGLLPEDVAFGGVTKQGINDSYFHAMLEMQRTYPDVATSLDMMRRGLIGRDNFIEYAIKSGYQGTLAEQMANLVSIPLSPADAALALLRGNMSRGEALKVASDAGVSEHDFDVLVNNTGEPLGLEQLLEAFRRGFINEGTLKQGILESRVRNEWIDTAIKLRYSPMSTADAVTAVVQGHLSMDTAKSYADQNGLEPGAFDVLYQTAGEPLSRTEMEELFNRGLVTEAEVEQALTESRLKNKYTKLAFQLHTKLLPIRNLSEAVEYGTITLAQGVAEAMKQGYSQQDATALIQAASARKLQTYRHQVVSAVETLYVDNAISEADAMAVAKSMGFDDAEATAVFAGAEYKRMSKMVSAAISAIRTKYVSRHIDESTASGLLDGIGVPANQRDQELALWTLERQANVHLLTPAQVVKANKLSLMDDAAALEYLENLGYSANDAGLLLQGA